MLLAGGKAAVRLLVVLVVDTVIVYMCICVCAYILKVAVVCVGMELVWRY